jgi:transposase
MWVATQDLPRSAAPHLNTRLNQILDTADFDRHVERLCQPLYADDVGRPGLSPNRYFRTYCWGTSKPRLRARHRVADGGPLSIRSFLGLEVQGTPDHSTVSRKRRLIDLETHQAVFTWVEPARGRWIGEGQAIGIDAITLEANAALRSIVRRDTAKTCDEFLIRLAHASGIDTPTTLARIDGGNPDRATAIGWTSVCYGVR